ncbi:hypothetical protein J4429_04540 [Candidatus Pacearchaeota archaeon]|nr:hypothetical protein [Candidatus Pacearchaeota archaeon]
MSEKYAIKRVFKSKKIVLCKEDYFLNVFKKLLSKSKIIEVYGGSSSGKNDFKYSLSSLDKGINDLIGGDFEFMFKDEKTINGLSHIKFNFLDNEISYEIRPHLFNVIHLKLNTGGMSPSEI